MRLVLFLLLGLAAGPAAGAERWGPIQESFAIGTGVCDDNDENITCAALMCEGTQLTLSVFGTGHGGTPPPVEGLIAVDGNGTPVTMSSRIMPGNYLHTRARISARDPLFDRLKAGARLTIRTAPGRAPFIYTLRGSSAEFSRVAARCG
ncbi:MAG: hypothetical protein AAGB15_13915 [Pseudomonadota bacterium]